MAFEPLLNSEEAAELLKIHPKTLQRMARMGRLPAKRIGDLWRFRASDLDRWMQGEVCSIPPLVPQNN
jgi:excisionase family DNA binding protein